MAVYALKPTITFTVADSNYLDNSGTFSVTAGSTSGPSPTPAPGTMVLVILGLMVLTLVFGFRTRGRSV